MRRREFITLLGGAAATWPLAARAQQPRKLPIIGYLGASTPAGQGQWLAAFRERLRELGWIEGRTVAIEVRWAENRAERYAEIAAEFVRLKVDVIADLGNRSSRSKAGDFGHSHRLCSGRGPRRQRLGRVPRAAGRQRHRPVVPVAGYCQQAPTALARGRPRPAPLGDFGQCRLARCRAGDERGSGSGLLRSASTSSTSSKSAAPTTSRPPSPRSRAGHRAFTCPATHSWPPTGFASSPWRSPRDCRRVSCAGSTSKRAG